MSNGDNLLGAVAGVRRRRWPRIMVGVAVGLVVVVVAAAVAFNLMWSRGWACTQVAGPVYDVATADEAFDAWWAEGGPRSAQQMATGAYPPLSVGPPERSDLVREPGDGGRASWNWEPVRGQRVVVSVDRVATQPGWMVAVNRCGRS